MDLTQGVHDALRLDSSQRPAEERHVEGRRLGEILRFSDVEPHAVGQVGWRARPRERDLLLVGVEPEDALGPRRVEPGQPAVAAADLEHACPLEVGCAAEDTSLGSTGVLDDIQGTGILSRYAIRRKTRSSRRGPRASMVPLTEPRTLLYRSVPPTTASLKNPRYRIEPDTTILPLGRKYVPLHCRSREPV